MIKIKTKEDIQILREGGKRLGEILRDLAKVVKPGTSSTDLETRARELITANRDQAAFLNYRPTGAKRDFPAALCVSVNDEVVHGIPNEFPRILKEGDIVSLDLGLVHGGLYTDSAITVPVGNVDEKSAALIDATKKALDAGIKAAKAGRKVGDISNAIQKVGVAQGFGIVEELAGHGVGYSVHEDPFVPNFGEAGKGETLTPGMVIAIEPMFNLGSKEIYLDEDGYTYKTVDGLPSAHFEHTVVITKSGAEVLTS